MNGHIRCSVNVSVAFPLIFGKGVLGVMTVLFRNQIKVDLTVNITSLLVTWVFD